MGALKLENNFTSMSAIKLNIINQMKSSVAFTDFVYSFTELPLQKSFFPNTSDS